MDAFEEVEPEDIVLPPDALEIQVGDWLRQRGLKLVVAESCTGGLVGHRLTNVPGSSEYYLGSITAYANEAKQGLLGVRTETLAKFGAVSQETAVEMARGVRSALSGRLPVEQLVGVSVTGIAGPGGGTADKPVGLVWIGLSAPGLDRAWKFIWPGDRVTNKALSAQQALQLLLDYLQGKGEVMDLEPVQAAARWQADGSFSPQQFTWKGQVYPVESTGRQWEDEAGLHVLCMIPGGKVFELVFQLNPAGWRLRPPRGSAMA